MSWKKLFASLWAWHKSRCQSLCRTWILPVASGTSNCRRIKHPIKANQGISTREYKKKAESAEIYIIAPINARICRLFLTLLFWVVAARIYSAFETPSDRHELPINFLYILNLMLHIMILLLRQCAHCATIRFFVFELRDSPACKFASEFWEENTRIVLVGLVTRQIFGELWWEWALFFSICIELLACLLYQPLNTKGLKKRFAAAIACSPKFQEKEAG